MNNTLSVYWDKQKVGRLWLMANGDFTFQYDVSCLQSPTSLPISLRLPLREEPFENTMARSFFINLLPEERIRQLIAKKLGISEKNDFSLLQELGGECAGALSLLPEDKLLNTDGEYELISPTAIDKMIENMSQKPLLTAKDGLRLSLAGAQHKIPIYIKGKSIFLPRGSFSSSHILKPAISNLEDTVINEAFCMKLAKECGLPSATVEIWNHKQKALIIRRYDRILISGKMIRIHQEDFCQALGYRHDQKYESDGGPSLKACLSILSEHSSEPIIDKRHLLQWVVFNTLIGNCDAHAKNISLMLTPDGIRLAPFYDLLSTRVYPQLSNKFAMKIGGENRGDWIMKRHWERLAQDANVSFKAILGFCQEMEETLPTAAKKLEKEFSEKYGPSKIIKKIVQDSDKKAKKLNQELSKKTSLKTSPPAEESVAKYAPEIKAAEDFLYEPVSRHINSFGGWDLQVYPTEYQANRFPDPRDVKRVLRKSEVQLRGWNFPHTDKGDKAGYFLNGWQSVTIFLYYIEGYRAYQSGLLVWKRVFSEDLMESKPTGKVLSYVNVIFQITEILLFIRNYFEAIPSVKKIRLQLTLHGTSQRRLDDKSIAHDYFAQAPEIILKEEIQIQELSVTDSSLKLIKKIFLLFQMEDTNDKSIMELQRKLLEGKWRV